MRIRLGWNRNLWFVSALACLGLASYYAGTKVVLAQKLQAPSGITALTSVAEERNVNPDDQSKSVVRAQWTEHYRSDGAHLRVKRAFTQSKQDELSSMLLELPNGLTIQAVPELKLKSSTYRNEQLRSGEAAKRLSAASGCVDMVSGRFSSGPHKLVAEEERLGQKTKVVSRGSQDGTLQVTRYAVEAGCYPLLERTEFYDQPGRLAEIKEREVTELRLGEPTVQFAIPGDFEEVSPSVMKARLAAFLGMAGCPECMKKASAREDETYLQMRPPTGLK